MPFSTGCHTPLSNFEAGQNYKDVNDPASKLKVNDMYLTSIHTTCFSMIFTCTLYLLMVSHYLFFLVIVNFPLDEDPSVSMIAWTTTPWTLPSNLGLCVHPDFTYVKVKGQLYCTYLCITLNLVELFLSIFSRPFY